MNLYGIGFLMDHLNIKPKQLADYLHVDRSLISKWRSGARKIDPNSLYLDKLIDFFISLDQPNHLTTLKLLLGLNEHHLEEDVVQDLKAFILNNKKPLLYDQYIVTDNTYAYITSLPVYNDVAGNRSAILNFLDIANKQEPCKLTFVYDGSLDLIRLDTHFHTLYLNKLNNLLDKGFHLEILYSTHNAIAISTSWDQLFSHENCTFLEFQPDIAVYKFALYILENQLILRQMFFQNAIDLNKNSAKQNHTLSYLFSDPLSISAYTQIAHAIKIKSHPLFHHINIDPDDIPSLDMSSLFLPKDFTPYFIPSNLIYYKSVYPPFYLMNEDTFGQVLEQSYSCQIARKNLLHVYSNWRKLLATSFNSFYITHFYSLLFLNQISKSDKIVLGYKNCLFSPEFTLTKKQLKIFLNDIADFLLLHKNFNICLTPQSSTAHIESKYDYYVSSKIFFVTTGSVRPHYMYSTNQNYINSTINMLQQKFFYADKNQTDKALVADTLRNLLTD